MNTFRVKRYRMKTEKWKEGQLRLLFLSDLHGFEFGENNKILMEAIKKSDPDLILIGGDLLTSSDRNTWEIARELVGQISMKYPVYMALGNHEQRLFEREEEEVGEILDFLKNHATVLNNESALWEGFGGRLMIHGLSLESPYYRKPFPDKLNVEHMESLLGIPGDERAFHILLAHNPYHGDSYFAWGSDLILSGHYHGGVVRFDENHGLISTHLHPFPKYCCGRFKKDSRQMIVSAGLGEHTIPIRIHNPRELLEITICPK